jgi:hypothetical protein
MPASPNAHLAVSSGAVVVPVLRANVAVARNAGAAVTTGQILVTIDAGRVMSPLAFAEIERLLATGCYVGGGAVQHPDRHSLAIDAVMALARLTTYLNGLGGGCTGAVARTSRRSAGSTREFRPSTTSTSPGGYEPMADAPVDAS